VGSLIDHSCEVWHLVDEDGTIRAIPDGQVKVAHIMRGDIHDFGETIKVVSENRHLRKLGA
jgi:hypothetical protein